MSNRRTPAKGTRRRWVREAKHRVATEDPTAAMEELQQINQRLLLAGASGKQDLGPLEAAVKRAAAKVDKCFGTITFRQLPADDYEELVSAHPPVKEGDAWNEETFIPAICEACSVSSDMTATTVDKPFEDLTAEEWAAEIVEWALGDRTELLTTVVLVNTRRLAEAIPKG